MRLQTTAASTVLATVQSEIFDRFRCAAEDDNRLA